MSERRRKGRRDVRDDMRKSERVDAVPSSVPPAASPGSIHLRLRSIAAAGSRRRPDADGRSWPVAFCPSPPAVTRQQIINSGSSGRRRPTAAVPPRMWRARRTWPRQTVADEPSEHRLRVVSARGAGRAAN